MDDRSSWSDEELLAELDRTHARIVQAAEKAQAGGSNLEAIGRITTLVAIASDRQTELLRRLIAARDT